VAEVKDVTVPDIGDFTDVPIVEVLVAEGDEVAADDPLVVLESDKASMEVPAPEAGTVKELKVAVGDTVSEGTVVLTLEPSGGGGDEGGDEKPEAEPSADDDGGDEKPEEQPQPEGDGSPADDADDKPGKDEPEAETAVAAEMEALPDETSDEPPAQPAPGAGTKSADEGPIERDGDGDGDDPVYASPSVRRRARELGVDLASIEGSGRKGRITLEDLDKPAEKQPAESKPPKPKGDEERVELSRIQKLSKASLTRSWQEIPHVTQHDEADITELEAFRKQLNAEQDDVKVTMVALLLKAASATLDQFPRFASSLDGDELIVKPQRHLGFAADTPNGLVVPVIRDVDQKGILQLAGELTELSGKARAGKLGPKDISGAVFTISSLGGIGGTGFTPIVNLPQVAILGVVRSATKPVWNGSEFEPRLMLPLSLSYDHRVIDGAAAARFCAHLAKVLSDLRRVLL
jgi:pyruvate dehydrogenase E2 component (dihydrolipoamide acetyltransferase)